MNLFKNLHYATHGGHDLHLNLQLPEPAAMPAPLIVWLTGGGWYVCDLDPIDPFLTSAGFAVASVRYRVSSEAIAPANVQDCLAAVRWLRANATRYRLDANNIGVFGSSAGGHLAALVGLCGEVDEFLTDECRGISSSVQAACDFCGPSDLTQIAESAYREASPRLYDVTARYLGGPVEERLDLARLVSPVTYAFATVPPLLIAHGDNDPVVHASESKQLYSALRAAGADATLHILPRQGHGWDWALTNDIVLQFFQRTLRPGLA